MEGLRRKIYLLGLAGMLGACSFGPPPVAQSSPSPTPASSAAPAPAAYLQSVALPPLCPTSAQDASVCQVRMPGGTGGKSTPTGHVGGNWSATSGESVLFRIGWVDSHQASCQAYIDGTTTTMSVDGHTVAFATVPCRLMPAAPVNLPADIGGLWFTDQRYISAPLSPGVHTASWTNVQHTAITYFTGCSNAAGCTTPAGTVATFSVIVTVS
jgi:hypothetical protein